MANIIKVDTSKLRSAASQFSATSAQIRNTINNMTQTVGNISGSVWSGEAATTYVAKFNGLNDEIAKIDKMIQEHVSDLNDMAAEYDRAEDQNKQTANALSNNLF